MVRFNRERRERFPPQQVPGQRPKRIIDQLEDDVGYSISIEDELNDRTFACCNLQDQSPLFSVLPREVRDLIFQYACAPFDDENHKYGTTAYYYRPGHMARQKTDTNLLLTCRRIWLEANAQPMLQAEHCYWYYRQAPDARDIRWMPTLTTMNRRNFGHLHLYAQMFAIENLSSRPGHLRSYFNTAPVQRHDFQPRMFQVTIRHTDWWNWESEAPLRFKESWLQALLDTPDLRSTEIFKLELETLDYKVVQLSPIINRLMALTSQEMDTHIVDGVTTSTKFILQGEPEVSTWQGPPDIDGNKYPQYKGKAHLTYSVHTLTWRLQFPKLGHVWIPEVRRAPRVILPTSDPFIPISFNSRVTPVRTETVFDTERRRSKRLMSKEPTTLAVDVLQDRWEKEGSLLKLAEA